MTVTGGKSVLQWPAPSRARAYRGLTNRGRELIRGTSEGYATKWLWHKSPPV